MLAINLGSQAHAVSISSPLPSVSYRESTNFTCRLLLVSSTMGEATIRTGLLILRLRRRKQHGGRRGLLGASGG